MSNPLHRSGPRLDESIPTGIQKEEESIPTAILDRTYELVEKHNPGKYDKDMNLMKEAISPDLRTHDGLEWRSKYRECVALLRRIKQVNHRVEVEIEELLHRLGE